AACSHRHIEKYLGADEKWLPQVFLETSRDSQQIHEVISLGGNYLSSLFIAFPSLFLHRAVLLPCVSLRLLSSLTALAAQFSSQSLKHAWNSATAGTLCVFMKNVCANNLIPIPCYEYASFYTLFMC
ncbi:mCG145245, partial [Mus musculus]